MADIRIKDLAVTASASSSDDYLAVDGSTNGTRKLSAYSPTFGGNLTVSGTGTIAGLTLSGGSFAAASLYKSSSLGTVLSGATGSSYDLFISNPSGSHIIQTPTGTRGIEVSGNISTGGNLTVSGGSITNGAGTAVYYFGTPSNNYLYYDGSSLYTRVGGSDRMTISGSTGNVLIGTATDLGQKLQVSGTAAISGALSIGNTVQTAVSVASTHKVTISIGGSTYYLLATNV